IRSSSKCKAVSTSASLFACGTITGTNGRSSCRSPSRNAWKPLAGVFGEEQPASDAVIAPPARNREAALPARRKSRRLSSSVVILFEQHLVEEVVYTTSERRQRRLGEVDLALAQHALGVGEGNEALYAVVATHARRADATESHVINADMADRVVQ